MYSIFDEIVDRRNTDSIKYDFALRRGKPEDALPLWVADMDFRTPNCVIEALKKRAAHGIFGYSESGDTYYSALQGWFLESTGWQPQRNWLVKTPGVVFAVSAAIRALTEAGEGVLIQEPVYYPFAASIRDNERTVVVNELLFDGIRYTIDFEDFENKLRDQKVRLFILCNPHNPVGRVFTKEELTKMGDLCVKYGVIVVADEIHQDFIRPGHQHTVFSDIKPEFAEVSVTCTAPSKTFNLAGLQISNIFIQNQGLRRRFRAEVRRSGYDETNIMGLVACQAAYTFGRAWFLELKDYLEENLTFIRGFLAENLSEIRIIEPEGTYLVWLDLRSLGLTEEEQEDFVLNKAKLWLDSGTMFGRGGSGFERINIACPRSVLQEAMQRLLAATEELHRPK